MRYRHLRRYGYVLFLLCLTAMITVRRQQDYQSSNAVWKLLNTALSKSEEIVDYESDDTMVYALIHKKDTLEMKDYFVVFNRLVNGEIERIYENDLTTRNPWKMRKADIDGDGEDEILIAVNKTTHYDPVEKNRMFIFNFNEDMLYKKWTGSQIAGVWKDFIIGDLVSAPGNELIFIEKVTENEEKISVYYWFDFGFFLLASSNPYQEVTDVIILEENHIQITCKENKELKTVTLKMKNGKLIETGP